MIKIKYKSAKRTSSYLTSILYCFSSPYKHFFNSGFTATFDLRPCQVEKCILNIEQYNRQHTPVFIDTLAQSLLRHKYFPALVHSYPGKPAGIFDISVHGCSHKAVLNIMQVRKNLRGCWFLTCCYHFRSIMSMAQIFLVHYVMVISF